jgi:hypothetical protein
MSPADKGLRLRCFGIHSGVGNEAGPEVFGPAHDTRQRTGLFIALLLLVEPLFRAGEVFRPFAQVEISTPRLGIGGLP